MSITINGQTSPATEFAWDGCHKIYLLDNGDADKNGKYGYCSPRTEKPDTRCCRSRNYSAYGTNPARSASSTTGRSTRIMFPNATRSPSPSKRVERESHEIIQDIRGRIRSGYRSRPMGVQPHSRHPIRHVGTYRIQDRLQISRPAGSPFIGAENRSRRKIVPGNRQYTKKSHHDRSKPGTRSRQGLTCRYSRA